MTTKRKPVRRPYRPIRRPEYTMLDVRWVATLMGLLIAFGGVGLIWLFSYIGCVINFGW